MERLDLFKAYFTQESKYYAEKLEKFENGLRYSFNFWAGFFGLVWFLYRKLYTQAVIIFIVNLVLSIVSKLILSLLNPYDSSNDIYSLLIIGVLSFVILGFIGNLLYLGKSIKAIDNFIKQHGIENIDNSMMNKIREKGGTSVASAMIFSGFMVFTQIIIKCINI